jgi:hypothetical protein
VLKLALVIRALEIAFDRDERAVAELLPSRYTIDSENLARKDLPIRLTWSLLQNDAGLKNFSSELDDFLYRRRILGFIGESPSLD